MKTRKTGFITRYYKHANQNLDNWQASGYPKTRLGAIKGAAPRVAMSRHRVSGFSTYAAAYVFEAATGRMVYSISWAGSKLSIIEFGASKAIKLIKGGSDESAVYH